MIDLHVIRHPTQVRNFSPPVDDLLTVHEVDGFDRHIGKGRALGFAKGTHDFVSFLDDDDTMDTSVLPTILRMFDDNPTVSAIVTDETKVTRTGGKRRNNFKTGHIYSHRDILKVHHLVVVRRCALSPFIYLLNNWPDLAEFSLWLTMSKKGHKFMHLAEFAYTWNIHDGNAKRLKITPAVDTIRLLKGR